MVFDAGKYQELERRWRMCNYDAGLCVSSRRYRQLKRERMKLKTGSLEKWVDAQDPYGGAVISYAERWAEMMESRMEKGEKLEDVANECSNEADTEGITGFMYGAAVSVLASCWEHGEELRRWHNLKAQIRDEGEKANESGGVLNPALLNIEAGE